MPSLITRMCTRSSYVSARYISFTMRLRSVLCVYSDIEL